MSPRSLNRLVALVIPLVGCQNFSTPSTEAGYVLDYPNGAVADLPHYAAGTEVLLAVKVTNTKGHPVAGVEVTWDDGSYPPTMLPNRALSDTGGLARTRWTIRPLPPDQFVANRAIRAYLPGADHNPIVYRIEVLPCTRC